LNRFDGTIKGILLNFWSVTLNFKFFISLILMLLSLSVSSYSAGGPKNMITNNNTNLVDSSSSISPLPSSGSSSSMSSGQPNTNQEYFLTPDNLTAENNNNNIIFDSYDEVVMKNFDKENVTQIKFIGNVKIRFDNNILKARTVIITTSSNKVLDISAFDKVEFKYGGTVYLCTSMSFNPNSKKGILKDVRSFMKGSAGGAGPLSSSTGWYYKAKKATILSMDRLVLEDVAFTYTPAELPHYRFFAQKIWYFKGEIIFALSDSYMVGQANFIWFPFFMEWDKYTGIRTAFGQEKRIGWYLMNTVDFNTSYGYYTVGLDIYERLGQYTTLNFKNKKSMGIFSSVDFFFEGANDVRVVYDQSHDRYSQVIPLNINGTNINTNISQLSWHYTLRAAINTNDLNISINWEDLNDPFFSSKYNRRFYNFDIRNVIQPFNNSFYSGHDDRNQPVGYTFNRSFSLNYKKLSIDGNWGYQAEANPDEPNPYVNDHYKFYLRTIQFPTIHYSLDTIPIFDFGYSKHDTKTIQISNTNYIIAVDDDITPYLMLYSAASNENLSNMNLNNISNTNNGPVSQVSNMKNALPNPPLLTNQYLKTFPALNTETNGSNQVPTTIAYSLKTNDYVYVSLSSYVNAGFSYTSYEFVDTNERMTPISDHYTHTETGSYHIDSRFFNNFISWNHSFNFLNNKEWSTIPAESTNNQNRSGSQLDYNTVAGINQNPSLFTGHFWQVNFPWSVSHTFNYQLFRSINTTQPRLYSHDTSLSTGFNLLEDNIDYRLSLSHHMLFRITNNLDDIYFDNMIERTIGASTSLKLWWLSANTGVTLNILETKTNYLSFDPFWQNFTNRIVSGNPVLTASFSPPALYQPLPSITYRYDLIRQTNLSLSASSAYSLSEISVGPIYRLEALNFNSSYNWDFLNMRSSSFTLGYSTRLWFNKYLVFTFQTSVLNNNLYRYFPESVTLYKQPRIDFWNNLLDSVNIFNYDGLKRGLFKIQGIHFGLTHYINEWQLDLTFDVVRKQDPSYTMFYWEPTLMISFTLTPTAQPFFEPYKKVYVPAQLQ
jgi:hypothetical protein